MHRGGQDWHLGRLEGMGEFRDLGNAFEGFSVEDITIQFSDGEYRFTIQSPSTEDEDDDEGVFFYR